MPGYHSEASILYIDYTVVLALLYLLLELDLYFYSSITTNIKFNNIDTHPIIVATSATDVISVYHLQLQSDEVETIYLLLGKLLQN